jgi:hypothetical protein
VAKPIHSDTVDISSVDSLADVRLSPRVVTHLYQDYPVLVTLAVT